MSCDPSFAFSIDGHQFTVIEVEGTNVQPLVVDSLEIFAGMLAETILASLLIGFLTGQRYSVVVSQSLVDSSGGFPHASAYSSRPTNQLAITVSVPFVTILCSPVRLCRTGIRALPHVSTRLLNFSDHTNVAILRYSGAPIADPSADSNVNIPVSQLPLVETNLHVRRLFSLDLSSIDRR